VFPEYNLLPWKFAICNHNFWDKVANQRKFFDWAGKELGVKEYTDWYNVLAKVTLAFVTIITFLRILFKFMEQ
jgi:hypothetical protein